jgi:hypothetical protein
MGRTGLRTNSPPQLGHLLFTRVRTQSEQNVHSKEQIIASLESGGRSRLQHSQLGFMSSIVFHPLVWGNHSRQAPCRIYDLNLELGSERDEKRSSQ